MKYFAAKALGLAFAGLIAISVAGCPTQVEHGTTGSGGAGGKGGAAPGMGGTAGNAMAGGGGTAGQGARGGDDGHGTGGTGAVGGMSSGGGGMAGSAGVGAGGGLGGGMGSGAGMGGDNSTAGHGGSAGQGGATGNGGMNSGGAGGSLTETGGIAGGMGGAGTGGECSIGPDCSYRGAVCQDRMCICQQKSSTNLLQEPGFDAPLSVSSWQTVVDPYSTWDSDDANGCPKSGSLKVVPSPPTEEPGGFAQCVRASGTVNYSLGFTYKQDRGSAFVCFVLFYGGPGCGVNFDPVLDTIGPFSDSQVRTEWTALSMRHMSPVGTQSITFRCSTSGIETVSFDQMFLNSAGGGF